MGTHAGQAEDLSGETQNDIALQVGFVQMEFEEGWTPASWASAHGVSFSTAQSKLYRGWRDGKFTRRRGRHADYGGRVGWVYREV